MSSLYDAEQKVMYLLQGFGSQKQNEGRDVVQTLYYAVMEQVRQEFDYKWDEKWKKKTQIVPEP